MDSFLHGTTIILVRTPDRLIISADQRRTDGITGALSNEVKIKNVDDHYFVTAGLSNVSIADPHVSFDLDELITSAILIGNPLNEIIAQLGETISGILENMIPIMYSEFPCETERDWWPGKWIINVVIGKFENGTSLLWGLDFQYSKNNHEIEVNAKLTDYSSQIDLFLMLGDHSRIDKLMKTRGIQYNEKTIGGDLIGLEIKSGNPNVGYPIDTVVLNSKGATWYKKTAP